MHSWGDLSTWIEVGVFVVGLVGGWFQLRAQVQTLTTAVDALRKAVDEDLCTRLLALEQSGVVATAGRAERGLAALHRRVDELDREMAVLKNDAAHTTKRMEESLARVESAIAGVGARIEGRLTQLERRIDDAVIPRKAQ